MLINHLNCQFKGLEIKHTRHRKSKEKAKVTVFGCVHVHLTCRDLGPNP